MQLSRKDASVPDVELIEVTKEFGAVPAVRDFSLHVDAGEFLCLLGPSGCGKTTLLRMIAGLEEPTSGVVQLRGQVMNGVPVHKRGTAMVFQNWALFPHKSIGENIEFGLKMRAIPKRERQLKAAQYLELVQLPGFETRMPHQLSGGQQQRIALARALIIEPQVLLLDEPFSNLDLKLRQQMRFELRQIQEKLKITTIFVTHDQTEALELSDRIAVVRAGSMEQLGSPADVYSAPRTPFVAEFIGESSFLLGKLVKLNSSEGTFLTDKGLTIIVSNRSGLRAGERATLALRPEHIKILSGEEDSPKNAFRGRISLSTYMGTKTRLYLELEGGEGLFVETASDSVHPKYQVGDEVTVGWEPEGGPLCFPSA